MNLRVSVVIPCFNNGRTISEAVKDIVLLTDYPVLIVDDGSETPVTNVLYSWEVRKALESGRVRVLRFEKNRGKGVALQHAIAELVSKGYTHMLTMDANGLHLAREIQKLVEIGKENPWDLILGDRKLKPENKKNMGRLSKFWVTYETGLNIRDPQFGFRLYPLFALQTMRFFASRYDFDLEVLIRLLWRGVHVREVEVDVAPNPEETHFRKFWDNVRLSTLNTILVVLSLFRTRRSPGQLAGALAAGVLIGCTPFYGFHWAIVIGVAFLFRLNVIITYLGTHVSTPVIMPLVLWAEVWIGRNWLHVAPENGPKGDFLQLLGGSFVLGIALSLVTAVVSYFVARAYQNRKPRSAWNASHNHRVLKFVLKHFGLDGGYFCQLVVAPYIYLFAHRARRGLSEYWKIMKPNLRWRDRQARVLRQIYLFLQIETERIFSEMNPETFRVQVLAGGEEHELQTAPVVTAHVGSPQLAAALFEKKGLRHLQPLMADRPQEDEGELVPFFGKLALFDVSPFKSGPVVSMFAFKGDGQTYEVHVKRPSSAGEYARELEQSVKKYPDQWFNFFPFWSSMP